MRRRLCTSLLCRQFAEIMISVHPLGALDFKWDPDSKRTPRKATPTVGTWHPTPVYGYGAIGPNAAYVTGAPSTRPRCLALSTAAKKGEPKGESSVAKVSALPINGSCCSAIEGQRHSDQRLILFAV
jgi:hypothetical protein